MPSKGLLFDQLAPSVSQNLYADRFDSHLQRLMTIDLSVHRSQNLPIVALTQRRYAGMEQTAFEMSSHYEMKKPLDIDWKAIEAKVDSATENIRETLGETLSSDLLRPLVKQTIYSYENFLIYDSMYPKSRVNPWSPTFGIIRNGILFATSDDEAFVHEFNKNIRLTQYRRQGSNLAVIVKGQPNRFGCMALDNKYSAQTLVFQYLFEKAKGLASSKSLDEIKGFLDSKGIKMGNINNIQILITTPLKKTGLIGSTIDGFFYIDTADDLKAAFEFHHVKSKSIIQVMDRYRQRQKEFEGLNLDSIIEDE